METTKVKDEIFEVGDKVVIKEWDEMVKEYGLSTYGDIKCHSCYFVQGMRKLCGEEAIITTVYPHRIELEFRNPNLKCRWTYTKEMIKHVKPQQIIIYQTGNKVIAKNETTKRVAMAIRSSEDKFDFKIGASIAFERLVGKGSINKARKIVKETREEKRKEIEVGNSVKIINKDKQYINYISFFEDNNISYELATKYYYGKILPYEELNNVFEVLAIGLDTIGRKVCIIRNKSKGAYTGCYLFAIDGLKKC